VDLFAVIVYVEANEPAFNLHASSPASMLVCEGVLATVAVNKSLTVSGRNNLVVGSSSSSLASVSGLSLVPSDELSIVGVCPQFLSPSTNVTPERLGASK